MKKTILLGALIAATLITTGCSNVSTNVSAGEDKELKNAYFEIAEKIEDNETIDDEYLNTLLDGYEHEEQEFTIGDDNNIKMQQHTYKKDKEILYVTHVPESDGIKIDLGYEGYREEDYISLSNFNSNRCEDKDKYKYDMFVLLGGSDLFKSESNTLDISESNLLDKYNKIANDLLKKKEIKFDDVKDKIKIEPELTWTEFQDTESEQKEYTFTEGIEQIRVQFTTKESKVVRISYYKNGDEYYKHVSDNRAPGGIERLTNLINQEELEVVGVIGTSPKDLETQKQAINTYYK